MKKIILILSSIGLAGIALPALAATTNFKDLVQQILIGKILAPIVPLLIGLGVVVFIYGVLVLMFSEGGEKKEEGKQFMLWGIIGVFVMVSLWGLVAIVSGTFNLDTAPQTIQITPP